MDYDKIEKDEEILVRVATEQLNKMTKAANDIRANIQRATFELEYVHSTRIHLMEVLDKNEREKNPVEGMVGQPKGKPRIEEASVKLPKESEQTREEIIGDLPATATQTANLKR